MSSMKELTRLMRDLEDQLVVCMRCGLCQAVCPVFEQTGREADVARGKLALLDGLMQRRWDHADHAEPADLYALFDIDADAPESRHRLHRVLRNKVIRFSRDRQTGYMEVSATAPSDPAFAAALANAVVEDLDRFNKTTQQARAREHRVFVESREADAQEKLREAEDALARFVNENRSYTDSPLLLVEYNRLSRLVTAQSTVWMELRRQTELARIDENKDLRSVTVLSLIHI